MFRERVQEYFSFTKKERIAVLALVFIILAIFVLPYLFSSKEIKTDQQSFNKFKNEIASLKRMQQNDSVALANNNHEADEENGADDNGSLRQKDERIKTVLFYFDPNTISTSEWEKLGLKTKVIHTIQNYLAKGGKFREPTDLKKIYGIYENDYRRLQPFVKIAKTEHAQKIDPVVRKEYHPFQYSSARKENNFSAIDINVADTASFISLPGIGAKLATRIIHFREKLGGFYSVEQVAEIYGLPDSTYQKIKPFLKIYVDSIRKIDINIADVNTLQQHPYIRWDMAKAIINYRNEHGMFRTVEDLGSIVNLPPERLKKILPYIKVDK